MSSTYSPNLKLELIGAGEQQGVWGTTTNTNLGTALEQAVVGKATLNAGSFVANVCTLTLTNTPAAQDARALCLVIDAAALSAAGTLNVPAIDKPYLIVNETAFALTVKVSGQTGVVVAANTRTALYTDGTDVRVQTNWFPALSVGSTPLPVVVSSNATTGLAKIASGVVTAAVAGTDYVAPDVATTFTALQSFNGTTTNLAARLLNGKEPITISATAATGVIPFDVTTQSIVYYTANATANWTPNFRASSSATLNSVLSIGECVTVAFLVKQGSPAYLSTTAQVDGAGVTMRWQGSTVPSIGNPNSIDSYTYTIVKTANATFTVFAIQAQFV
jgi:hypothetical protein